MSVNAVIDLSARLLAVAELVPLGARVADVGAGHARLAAWLVAQRRARSCVATDPDAAAFEQARSSFSEIDGLELRLGRGLHPLRTDDRVDVVVVAGLGAKSILRILDPTECRRLGPRRIVTQPQTDAWRVREALVSRGLEIVDERLVVDRGRPYFAIAAEPSASPRPTHPGLSVDDLFAAGPILVRSGSPEVRAYWSARLRRLAGLRLRGDERAAAEAAQARRILEALEGPARAGGSS